MRLSNSSIEALSLFTNKTLWGHVLDALFPPSCAGCQKGGTFLCLDCVNKFIPVKQPSCFFCGKLTSHFESCPSCRSKTHLSGVIPAFYYSDLVKKVIAQFKYHDLAALDEALASYMAESILRYPEVVARLHGLVPIPLHFWRKSFRGYNQAALLARKLSSLLNKPLYPGLARVKATLIQAKLSKEARRTNLENAFRWEREPLMGRNILLVDDVATSGETLNEAARALRRAGAREVWGAIFAKG